MSSTFRLAGALVLTIAAIVAAAGVFTPGKASAAGTQYNCYFFNGLQWQCDISNPDGISQVILTWDTFQVELWNETYENCPTEVTIGPWGDEVQGNMTLQVEPCSGFGLKAGGGGDGRDLGLAAPRGDDSSFDKLALAEDDAAIVGLVLIVSADATGQAGISSCYAHYPSCSFAQYMCQHLGQECPPPSSRPW